MNKNRPLSPHLQVYRLPLTGLISITHRMTGVLLSLGLLLFSYMLSMLSSGEPAYRSLQTLIDRPLIQVVFWGFVYALFFHLCHGIRHLIWDCGSSFERDTMNGYAVLELLASIALTAAIFFIF
ncbi:succinate dehydrogenase, cytochrome b556 subunit [Methylomarinum vadi]|uniref:succinate dehydrogenase, cytochrome b556 subunit n=1 Tax=Methylomarinum vadi TaxID=438855 RepID=UPI0004DF9CE8|nr:succinate dehydrogenase, cytochrome b556 subunit [Methylomarinum vadi]